MKWADNTDNPLLVENYDLLKETGILEYIEKINIENKGLKNLINESYDIFKKESVEELIELIIKFLSEKVIPTNLIFVLNEGVMVNRIKIMAFKNLKSFDCLLEIDSLDPFEKFFEKYAGTTSFSIFENDMAEKEYNIVSSFKKYNPEIIVPISGISGLYGIILFGPKILGEEYKNSEIAYIDSLVKFTSIGIQNTIHYEHSVRDSKTGLYNHNFFIKRMKEELARSRRNKSQFSMIIMDIDKFKKFNDTYGHLAGDQVILEISSLFKHTIREEDILSRFGGEEFTVLLPDTDKTDAWNAAERFRKKVESYKSVYQGNILKITISLGIATYSPDENPGLNDLINNADSALYLSKKNGRNQTSLYKSISSLQL